jgi:glutathione reductase (NADPH)
MKKYDLIVVGSEAAARTAAPIATEAGRKVAVVDERPFGGTCL